VCNRYGRFSPAVDSSSTCVRFGLWDWLGCGGFDIGFGWTARQGQVSVEMKLARSFSSRRIGSRDYLATVGVSCVFRSTM
jgi:hypothetical protein